MAKKNKGLFITFEGIDGSGKSTQLSLARQFLTELDYSVATIREPGSTDVSERIRELLLDPSLEMTDLTELMLYEAARADLSQKEITPLLKKGTIVLADRFYDSTTAYQGYGRGLDIRMVKKLHKIAVGDLTPDLTLLFDIGIEEGLRRCGKVRDRLESQPMTFFKRVRDGFLEIARKEKGRIKIIDSLRSIEEVFVDVTRQLNLLISRL